MPFKTAVEICPLTSWKTRSETAKSAYSGMWDTTNMLQLAWYFANWGVKTVGFWVYAQMSTYSVQKRGVRWKLTDDVIWVILSCLYNHGHPNTAAGAAPDGSDSRTISFFLVNSKMTLKWPQDQEFTVAWKGEVVRRALSQAQEAPQAWTPQSWSSTPCRARVQAAPDSAKSWGPKTGRAPR